jgi:cell division protein FtsQ
MARETRVSAAPPNARRVSRSLDPNRSSMRRVAPRRNTLSRPSIPPRFSEPPSAPRNRKVAREEPAAPRGPGLMVRSARFVWHATYSVTLAVGHAIHGLSVRVAPRLFGPATNAVRVLVVCAFLAGALALGRFVRLHLTTAPAFAVDRIDVRGLSRLERSELLEAAGLTLGMNVFARSPEEVRARLLRHPWILAADVQRRLPSRFEIALRERAPVAMMVVEGCQPGGAETCDEPSSMYLVSDEGKMFKRFGGKDPVDLPVLTGITRKRVASDPDLSRRVLRDAVQLVAEYRAAGLDKQWAIGELHLEANDGLSLYVGDDLTYVRLGFSPFAQKLTRMKRVFERLAREHARADYVYLDNEQHPERVTVRLR